MNETKEPKIYYKIEAGKKYRIWKSTYNEKDYYKIQVTQKNYDGTKDTFYIGVQFKRGIDLPNETDIIIKTAYENFRKNPKDQYNWIPYLLITDFETCEREEQVIQQAYDEFRDNLDEIEEITDEDLPW